MSSLVPDEHGKMIHHRSIIKPVTENLQRSLQVFCNRRYLLRQRIRPVSAEMSRRDSGADCGLQCSQGHASRERGPVREK